MSSNSGSLATSTTPTSCRPATSRAEQEGTETTMPRPTSATSSASSTASMAETEDQFVFSPHKTPSHEPSSFFPPTYTRGGASSLSDPLATGGGQQNTGKDLQNCHSPTTTTTRDSPIPHSRPIAIELPPSISHRIAAKSVYTPIEPPLTGRSGLQGGYFVFHEDSEKSVSQPQPFQNDKPKTQRHPQSFHVNRFQSDQPPPVKSSLTSIVVPDLQDQQPATPMGSATMSSSRTCTPITSYVPSGHQNSVPMSLGKYYPTNYEAARSRQSQRTTQSRTPRTTLQPPFPGGPSLSSSKSDSKAPQLNKSDAPRSRTDSDAKRRLQQYQRDMVAQATQAARSLAGAKNPASLAAAHGVVVPNFPPGSTKPTSPRLQPLGSPGPVTPMELESQVDSGYLTQGRAVPSPDSRRENEAIARALQAEEERKQREGRGSPTVQAGGLGL